MVHLEKRPQKNSLLTCKKAGKKMFGQLLPNGKTTDRSYRRIHTFAGYF